MRPFSATPTLTYPPGLVDGDQMSLKMAHMGFAAVALLTSCALLESIWLIFAWTMLDEKSEGSNFDKPETEESDKVPWA